jgi:hypothetical protein
MSSGVAGNSTLSRGPVEHEATAGGRYRPQFAPRLQITAAPFCHPFWPRRVRLSRRAQTTPVVGDWSTGPAAIAEAVPDQRDDAASERRETIHCQALHLVRTQPALLLGGPRSAFPPQVEFRAAIAANVASGTCDYEVTFASLLNRVILPTSGIRGRARTALSRG